MSAQTTYKFNPVMGAAGGIVDLAPYEVNAFIVEENTGVMQAGVAVVSGTKAGSDIKLPTSTSGHFEGITTNRRTNEHGLEGETYIRKGQALGVMRYGRIYGRVKTGVSVAYGEQVYVLVSGDEKGYLTNVSTDNMPINATFQSAVDNGVAIVEIANAPYVASN